MSILLRTLVVWLLLLALPYQGYASATMLLCAQAPAVASSASSASALHDHAAMLAAQAHGQPARHIQALQHSQHSQHDGHGMSGHDGVKCSAGACCLGAALAPTFTVSLPALAAGSSAIPFFPDFLPAVHLAHPERPPQGRHA